MRTNWRLRLLWLLVLVGAAVTIWVGYRLPEKPTGNALLSGPPEFIILALIVSLGLYLRQVNLHAFDLQDKIRTGEAWNTARRQRYAAAKVSQLDNTSSTIILVSPFLIALTIIVGVRIVCDSVIRFYYDNDHTPRFLYIFDLVIVVGLFAMLCGLAAAHFVARRNDNRIRDLIRSEEMTNPAGQMR